MPRIAVVEDSTELLSLLRELFAERGWELLPCPDGNTALALIHQEHPDVILLDIWLEASISGWEILRQVQADSETCSIPVIIWSGAAGQLKDKEDWLAEHGIQTLSKPFELDETCTQRST